MSFYDISSELFEYIVYRVKRAGLGYELVHIASKKRMRVKGNFPEIAADTIDSFIAEFERGKNNLAALATPVEA